MTGRSLIWRTLKVTVLRPYFKHKHSQCLQRITQLERELWPTVTPTNYTQIFETRALFGVSPEDFSTAPGAVIPVRSGGQVYYLPPPNIFRRFSEWETA